MHADQQTLTVAALALTVVLSGVVVVGLAMTWLTLQEIRRSVAALVAANVATQAPETTNAVRRQAPELHGIEAGPTKPVRPVVARPTRVPHLNLIAPPSEGAPSTPLSRVALGGSRRPLMDSHDARQQTDLPNR